MSSITQLLQFRGGHQLPMILQTEVAECGLACLAMVASYYGHEVDLNALRRRFSISLKGTTMHELIKLSEQLALSARPVKVELEHLAKLNTPCVLHWDMNHFVVLKAIRGKHVWIHDPAVGERRYTLKQFGQHFTGVALELSPTFQFTKKRETRSLKLTDLWSKIGGLHKTWMQILLLSLIMQLFVIVGPFYLQMVIDEVVVSYDARLLTTLGIGFLLVLLVNVAVTTLRSYVVLYLSSSLSLQMAYNLFQHLLKLPLDYFEKRHMGDIVSRFGSLSTIKDFLAQGAVTVIVDALMAVVTLIMMFIYSPLLTLVVLLSVGTYLGIRMVLYRPLRMRTEESVVTAAKSDSNFMETVRGMQSIKIFGRESDRKNLWVKRYADVMNADIRVGRLGIGYNAVNSGIFGFENILVVFIAAHMVLGGEFSVGMMMAFIAYKTQFTGKAASLVEQLIQFKMLDVHLDRLSDIALTDPDQFIQGGSSRTTIQRGEIELKGLSYRYSKTEPVLFKDIHLKVAAGESVAIVGPSGCGKTTLLKMMLGLFQPLEGQIKIDGQDIRQMGLQTYREQVGVVMQDDQLLSGSIADNICFFDHNPDMGRIHQSAELAAINRDIEKMPMGYNSLVGDMGTTLSGGQKQRILLARALYRRPKILFLDEATSHLDTRLEGVVNSNLKQHNITTIMIAHRPDTIRWADRVYLLEGNQLHPVEVQQQGTPGSPMATTA